MQRHTTGPEVIVALDVPSVDAALSAAQGLADVVRWYKVGLELYIAAGPGALEALRHKGRRIFLDLKLHDIPRTVSRAVAAASVQGAAMLTVHAGGGSDMLRAAADASREQGPRGPIVVAVTTLTSLDDNDLRQVGVTRSVADHSLALAELALTAGVHGLVCSVHELAAFRRAFGAGPVLVTPGIRPAEANAGDQKRIATPAAAVAGGANYLVVGRPILEASEPRAAALAIVDEVRLAAGRSGAKTNGNV